MSMKGILWGVLAENQEQYEAWMLAQKPETLSLQRCKPIRTMLDVYQAQKGAVQIIQVPGWTIQWNPDQTSEIRRRLEI